MPHKVFFSEIGILIDKLKIDKLKYSILEWKVEHDKDDYAILNCFPDDCYDLRLHQKGTIEYAKSLYEVIIKNIRERFSEKIVNKNAKEVEEILSRRDIFLETLNFEFVSPEKNGFYTLRLNNLSSIKQGRTFREELKENPSQQASKVQSTNGKDNGKESLPSKNSIETHAIGKPIVFPQNLSETDLLEIKKMIELWEVPWQECFLDKKGFFYNLSVVESHKRIELKDNCFRQVHNSSVLSPDEKKLLKVKLGDINSDTETLFMPDELHKILMKVKEGFENNKKKTAEETRKNNKPPNFWKNNLPAQTAEETTKQEKLLFDLSFILNEELDCFKECLVNNLVKDYSLDEGEKGELLLGITELTSENKKIIVTQRQQQFLQKNVEGCVCMIRNDVVPNNTLSEGKAFIPMSFNMR